jgi:hypothetical protein
LASRLILALIFLILNPTAFSVRDRISPISS